MPLHPTSPAAQVRRAHYLPTVLAFVAMGVLLACGRPGETAQAMSPAVTAPGPRVVDLEPFAVVGCADCDRAERFSSVLWVETDGEVVVVVDRYEPFIRVFSRSGETVAQYGDAGEGPGELVRPMAAWLSQDRTVYVLDLTRRRLSQFSQTGGWIRDIRVPRFPVVYDFSAREKALYYVSYSGLLFSGASGVYRLDVETGKESVVIADLEGYPLGPDGGPAQYFPIALAPDGGMVIGEHADIYRYRTFQPGGEQFEEIRTDIPRTPKTDEELAEETRAVGSSRFPYSIEEQKLHYYLWAFDFDSKGRLWVRAGRSGKTETLFDIFHAGRRQLIVRVEGEMPRGRTYALGGDLLVGTFFVSGGHQVVRSFLVTESVGRAKLDN